MDTLYVGKKIKYEYLTLKIGINAGSITHIEDYDDTHYLIFIDCVVDQYKEYPILMVSDAENFIGIYPVTGYNTPTATCKTASMIVQKIFDKEIKIGDKIVYGIADKIVREFIVSDLHSVYGNNDYMSILCKDNGTINGTSKGGFNE